MPSRSPCGWSRLRRGSTATPQPIPSWAARRSPRRPRHRVADGRQPRPGHVPRPRHVRHPRPNARSHLAFAQGPHACVGIHLAQARDPVGTRRRAGRWPGSGSTPDATPPTGVIFRKPRSLPVRWDPSRPQPNSSSRAGSAGGRPEFVLVREDQHVHAGRTRARGSAVAARTDGRAPGRTARRRAPGSVPRRSNVRVERVLDDGRGHPAHPA